MGGATAGTNKELSGFVRTNSNVRIAADGLRGALHGDINALDNMAQSLAMINPQMVKLGGALTALALGVQLGKQIDQSFGISDRIAAAVNGVDPSSIETSAEKLARKIKELDAARKRYSQEMDSVSAATIAKIGAETEGEAASFLQSVERARRDSEKLLEQIQGYKDKVSAAQNRVESEEGKSALLPKEMGGQDLDAIRKAREELAAAQLDAESFTRISESQSEAIAATVKRVYDDAKDAVRNLELEVESNSIESQMARWKKYAREAQNEIDLLGAAIAAMPDPRLRDAANAAARGNPNDPLDPAKLALENAKNDVAAIDKFSSTWDAMYSRSAKDAARLRERQRQKAESAIRIAEAARNRGGPMNPAQQRILDVSDKTKAEAEAANLLGGLKGKIQDLANRKEDIDAIKQGIDGSQTAKTLEDLKKALEKNLQAA